MRRSDQARRRQPGVGVQLGRIPNKPIAPKRLQGVEPEEGDFARPNPNSAAVWHYSTFDQNGDGKIDFTETMHRTLGSVAIKDDILYIADYSGVFHCLDAKTGKPQLGVRHARGGVGLAADCGRQGLHRR